ncbi:MAG: helix-turn-helix domain-containing protein [Clostridia bacterium]|nr:helix-turn-helix domain-containing protein [Clostridia bacterium]
MRIENAKTLLKEGLSSEEVAFRIGFKNASYFVKIFKKYVGITPAKYRQS